MGRIKRKTFAVIDDKFAQQYNDNGQCHTSSSNENYALFSTKRNCGKYPYQLEKHKGNSTFLREIHLGLNVWKNIYSSLIPYIGSTHFIHMNLWKRDSVDYHAEGAYRCIFCTCSGGRTIFILGEGGLIPINCPKYTKKFPQKCWRWGQKMFCT